MIYKTCAKELVIPLIAAIPEIVAVMFVDVHSTDFLDENKITRKSHNFGSSKLKKA